MDQTLFYVLLFIYIAILAVLIYLNITEKIPVFVFIAGILVSSGLFAWYIAKH